MPVIPDPAQTLAINSGIGLVRVTAGAGTGKTTVLTSRIERLVSEGEEPASILATTFTNKAAAEMRERLETRIPNASQISIRTIDSAALRLCFRNSAEAGLGKNFLITDDDEQQLILREAAAGAGLIYEGMDRKEHLSILKEFSRRISAWKASGLVPENRKDDWTEGWRRYSVSLRERNLMDFSDIVIGAVQALSDHNVKSRESGRIKWLLVDEFQDTNAVQLQFLRLLSSVHRNVFIVGDPDQSIYSFRKAYPGVMEQVRGLLPEAAEKAWTSVTLSVNRRCTDQILKPACILVDYNEREEPKHLVSGRNGNEVETSAHATCSLEAENVAREIHALRSSGIPFSGIAVLARNNKVLDSVAEKFPAMGIPYFTRGGVRFQERSEVKDVMAYVKLSINSSHDLAFRRIISRPARGLGPVAADAVVGLSRSSGISLYDALQETAAGGLLKSAGSDGAAMLASHLRNLTALRERGVPPTDLIEYILGDIGYAEWAYGLKDAPSGLKGNLSAVLRIASGHSDIADFAMDSMLDAEADDEGEGVSVGTIHASKGLEWSHVFIIGAEEGIMPSRKAMEDKGNPDDPWDWRASGGLEEERRLLHVAMTRAKDGLHISYSTSRRAMQSRPSRLIREAELQVERPKPTASSFIGGGKGRGKPVSRKRQLLW